MGGRIQEILFSFAILTIPMLTLSSILLGLIYHFQVVHNDPVSTYLRLSSTQGEPGVIYVNLSATTLAIVSSWSSSVAPLLLGSALTLISYPVAKKILLASRDNKPNQLLTPYQLSLMLRMLANGSLLSLWSWLKYSFGWRGRRESQGWPVKTMTWILFLGLVLRFVRTTYITFPPLCISLQCYLY